MARLPIAAPVAVAVAVALSGCGSSGDDGDKQASSTTALGLSTTTPSTQALVPGAAPSAAFPGLGGHGLGQGPPVGAACAPLPPHAPPIPWLPPDLPFPTGTYSVQDGGIPPGGGGFNRGFLAVQG